MATDPYIAPSAPLDVDLGPVETSLWSARGRVGVLTYWAQYMAIMLFLLLIAAVIGTVIFYFFAGGDPANLETAFRHSPIAGPLGLFIGLPLLLALLYLGICLLIKRLHDLNLRGWWSLLMFIPIVGSLFGLYAMFWPGRGANRFGGPRTTRGWEKIVGVISMLLFGAIFLFSIFGLVTGLVTGMPGF